MQDQEQDKFSFQGEEQLPEFGGSPVVVEDETTVKDSSPQTIECG